MKGETPILCVSGNSSVSVEVKEGGVSVFLAVMGFSRWLVSDFYLYFLPQSRWTLN